VDEQSHDAPTANGVFNYSKVKSLLSVSENQPNVLTTTITGYHLHRWHPRVPNWHHSRRPFARWIASTCARRDDASQKHISAVGGASGRAVQYATYIPQVVAISTHCCKDETAGSVVPTIRPIAFICVVAVAQIQVRNLEPWLRATLMRGPFTKRCTVKK